MKRGGRQPTPESGLDLLSKVCLLSWRLKYIGNLHSYLVSICPNKWMSFVKQTCFWMTLQ